MQKRIGRLSLLLALAPFLLVAIVFFVYQQGFTGGFLLDDYQNLLPLTNKGGVTDLKSLSAFVFGNQSGPLGRPVSMLSFLIDDQYWPSDPSNYKQTNVMLHCINALLFAWLSILILKVLSVEQQLSWGIAFIAALIWACHPLNVSTTLYIVQRMNLLATLFSLCALICFIYGRLLLNINPRLSSLLLVLTLAPFGLLALLSKENGVLILVYICVLEWIIFSKPARNKMFLIWYRLLIQAPLIMLVIYFAITWEQSVLSAYSSREFDLHERLLTQARVLFDYLNGILLPRTFGLSIFHDDYVIAKSLFNPGTTILYILFIGGIILAGVMARKAVPIFSLAVFWFLGGHLLESTFLPLEMYFEHRNYMPMMGVILFVVWGGSYLLKSERQFIVKFLVAVLLSTYTLVALVNTSALAQLWGNTGLLKLTWSLEHPESKRAQIEYSEYLSSVGHGDKAAGVLSDLAAKFPNDISIRIRQLSLACLGREIVTERLNDIAVLDHYDISFDSINGAINRLTDLYVKGFCQGLDRLGMEMIFSKLEKHPRITQRPRVFVQLLDKHADIATYWGDLGLTVSLLERAFTYQPTVDILLKQTDILSSAGLFKDALEKLNMAIEIDRAVGFREDSREGELLSVKKLLMQTLEEERANEL